MPRPGPRPYECVRRAWHSERHQPLRGSIVQQIFRVVNDAHSPATKKNKEWQEKLPVVVLKAEEIMYSKANSEGEYLNLETLWERLNDAINTIIRRDETTETGDLLPPCVEAALNLGCKPVRTSRSDRHNNPRTYLAPRTQQPPPSGPPKSVGGNPINYTTKFTSSTVSGIHVSDSNQYAHQNSRMMGSCNYPFSDSFPSGQQHHQPLRVETKSSMNMGSVYPLYYSHEAKEPQLRTANVDNTCSDTIFVGRPVMTPVPEPSGIGRMDNFSYGRFQHVPNRIAKEPVFGTHQEPPDRECDLSLRLGQSLHPGMNRKGSSAYEMEDAGLRGSQDGRKLTHLSMQKNKELCFYPRETGYGTVDSANYTKYNGEGEDQNLETAMRKRKAPVGNNEEDGQFCQYLGVPSNQFSVEPKGQVRR
ncbi:hypothetical protein Lal_00050057 [Lupinus albus]|uniref:Uncharacterized protein n=1 Tax=Lupinus albus TaxID=3870 RepID=A0A6A5M1F5_LUPAL|nr:hypothetical protein Lalb_Chr12g0198041 [Lupinus albus]KAF1867626.1 hypothetical protein Lal_00050057 [Lupinus albus]